MVQKPKSQPSGEALLLDIALETIPFGFCVWSSEFKLVMWNRHYLETYGFSPRAIYKGMSLLDVVALSCRLGNHPDTDPRAFYEAYTAELLGNKSGLRAVNLELTATGRTLETSHVYAPGLGWVVTHEDVTEEIARSDMMAERKRELEQQYGLLDAAINNISHGLSMFDAEFRLVTCNAEYGRMYGLPPHLLKPGTPFRDILSHRKTIGRHAPDDIGTYIADRMRIMTSGKFVSEVVRMADGTFISFRQQPLKGGGLVTTHEDITEQLATEARIRHMATHDALTDLPNRALFREQAEEACARLEKGSGLALLLVNLDHFKTINDTDGHETGDSVLRAVARKLTAIVGDRGVVARWGGDEFAVLAQKAGDPHAAADLAASIVVALGEPITLGRKSVTLGASVGITVAPGDSESADGLINNAELALWKAKAEGRGTYHFFENGMDAQLQRRRLLETGLRDALARNLLQVHYQPLVSAQSGEIICAEALLRWTHPELGPISPSEFIPVAEDAGLIVAIGARVLEMACQEAASWPDSVHVAVNLSSLQFARDGLVETVSDALMVSGLAPGRLELEITESLLLADSESNIETLHGLRAMGIGIAMDDFGTGYSSLSYLRSFPFNKIKIDRSFMTGIAEKPENRAILKAMIGLGTSLGMETVVEGVETAEQLTIAKADGCSQIQGYYYSPPVQASDFVRLLARQGQLTGAARRTG